MDFLNEKIDIFELESDYVCIQFPNLKLEHQNNVPYLTGFILLRDNEGAIIDEYQISIEFNAFYPKKFPNVFELGGKIPKNIDWHIYNDGSCCIASPPEETLACIEGITLVKFIKNHLLPYLYNQTFRRQNGYFLNERSHGNKGWLEFFFEILHTNRITNVIIALEYIVNKFHIDRRSLCFCGSNIKYRKCHRNAITTLEKLPIEDIRWYIHILKLRHM